MSNNWRRYEVLLPLHFNDGRDVPAEWLAEAALEIVDHFGAVSYETQRIEGHWRQGGVLYRDSLVRLVVQVARRVIIVLREAFGSLGPGADSPPLQRDTIPLLEETLAR